MIKCSYVDDGSGGGNDNMVDKLMGEGLDENGTTVYTGTVAQILAYCGFTIKVMVRSGETRPAIVEMLGGGVLGMTWEPGPGTPVLALRG